MTHWSLRPALAPGGRYVCIASRLRSPSANLQARRQQHAVPQTFSTSEHDTLVLNFGKGSAKGEEEKDKSPPILKRKSKGTSENNKSKSAAEHSTQGGEPGQPSAEARNLQRSLHEKFVARRRKAALATQSPEKDSRWGKSRSKDSTEKAQKVNKEGVPTRKSKTVKEKQHLAKVAIEPSSRPHGALHGSQLPDTAVEAPLESKQGKKRGKAKSREVSNKAQIDKKAGVPKRISKLTKKKQYTAEAAMTTTKAVLPRATIETPVTRKSGAKQREKTSSQASAVPGPHASDVEAGTSHSNEVKSGNPSVMEQLKSYFRGLKETWTAEGSANQHVSSPVQQEPVQKLVSPRRRRGKKRRAKSEPRRKRRNKAELNVRRVKSRLDIQRVASTPAANKEPAEAEGRKQSSRSGPNHIKNIQMIDASDLEITALDLEQPPVPHLSYGLERVLFNPGVYHIQDPRSRVYNFDPYLQTIMPVEEFDFNALKEYITSSRDTALQVLAASYNKRYVGSSSSMTGVLAHFHFLLSQWRAINTKMLSREFPQEHITEFTELQRSPTAIFLKWRGGSYAIDADKEFAGANVLMLLGKSMEKLLTLDTEDFEKYRKSSTNKVPEEKRKAPEAYHYSTMGDFIMRSQLDAHDPRLPGTGMFDLKTRAVVSVRMEASNFEEGSGYQIKSRQGAWESFEREYFDMIRSAFLRYSLQVRMGRMDGIFVAFHNTDRIFGFQYVSLSEMDSTLHGQWDTNLGDQEFKFSVALLNEILDKATKKYPDTSLRLHFETRKARTNFMYIFAEPVTEQQITAIQTARDAKVKAFEEELYGKEKDGNGSGEDQGWENLQANVQDSMDEDIRDPNHEDGRQDLNPVLAGSEQGRLKQSHTPYDRNDDGAAGEEKFGKAEEDTAGQCAEIQETFVEDAKAQTVDRLGLQGAALSKETAPVEETDAEGEVTRSEKNGGTMTISEETGIEETAHIRSADSDSLEGSNDGLKAPLEESAGESQPDGHTDGDATFTSDEAPLGQSIARDPQTIPNGNEVLAFTLTIRNRVNGKYVLRPDHLQPHDKWSIEYSLDEVPNPQRARSLYQACQARRKKKLDKVQERSENDEQVDGYIRRLREMSRAGAKWRKGQDEKDSELPVRVLGQDVQEDKRVGP
ncbi:MAG: hypothetical protein Q9188_004483 [Gyalolechia gomerana]